MVDPGFGDGGRIVCDGRAFFSFFPGSRGREAGLEVMMFSLPPPSDTVPSNPFPALLLVLFKRGFGRILRVHT